MTVSTTTTLTTTSTATTTTEQRVAEAFRLTALKLEDAIERGRHSGKIDAEDLLQTLLSIADDLDPPVRNDPPANEREDAE